MGDFARLLKKLGRLAQKTSRKLERRDAVRVRIAAKEDALNRQAATVDDFWRAWERLEVVNVSGPETVDVFTYDVEAVKGLRVGELFEVQLSPLDARIKSTSTGAVWDSATDGGVPVAFNGRVFGFLGGCEWFVRFLQSEGKAVCSTARVTRWNRSEGFPYIEVAMLDTKTRNAYLAVAKDVGAGFARFGVETAAVTAPPEACYISPGMRGLAQVELAPPVGSRKPEAVVFVGGRESFRVGARSGAYGPLSSLAGVGPVRFACATEYREGMALRVHIEVPPCDAV